MTKTNCRARALANFFLFSKRRTNYTTDEVIAFVLNGSDIEFSDSDDGIQEDFARKVFLRRRRRSNSVPVNKDAVSIKESLKEETSNLAKEFDKPNSTLLHDHTIGRAPCRQYVKNKPNHAGVKLFV